MSWIENGWYGTHKQTFWLWPLWLLYSLIVQFRRTLFKTGIIKSPKSPLPVVVVGNITVGGTGKTPFVLFLVQKLKAQGFKPAIVSRGYGATQSGPDFPRLIDAETPIEQSGDEPKLMALRSACPVVISPKRCDAVAYVAKHTDADIVISDDGLQHYAMAREVEIVIVDAKRQFGNGWQLPVGPLREPISRLDSVDLVVQNYGFQHTGEYQLRAGHIYNLAQPGQLLEDQQRAKVHLVSGIGNPSRFVDTVLGLNLEIASQTWFPDHHPFSPEDFGRFEGLDDAIVLMTEKDAVKCAEFAKPNWFVLPISAVLSEALENRLLNVINQKCTTYN